MVFLDLRYKRRFLELVTGVGIVAIRVHNAKLFLAFGVAAFSSSESIEPNI